MTASQGGTDALEQLVSDLRPLLSPSVDEWIEDCVTWVLREAVNAQSVYIVAATHDAFDVTVGEGVHTVRGLTCPELEPLVSLLGVEMLFTAKSAVPFRRPYLSLGSGTPVLAREARGMRGGQKITLIPVPGTVDHVGTLRSELSALLPSSVTEFTEHGRWYLQGRRQRQSLSIGYEGGSTISLVLGDAFKEMVDFPKKELSGVIEHFDRAELSWAGFSVMGISAFGSVLFSDGHRVPSNPFRDVLSRIAEEERLVVPRADVRPE